MSTYLNNLFNYSRKLPAPFDTLSSKTVEVSSIYGDGKSSTLCCTVIKAVNAYCNMLENGNGGLGKKDTLNICEYRSKSDDDYHLVVYDPDSGALVAAVYDAGTELCSPYVLNSRNRDGAACLLAMLPALMSDSEFSEALETYKKQYAYSFSDFDTTLNAMALMCDNAYRRIKSGSLKANVDKTGNLMRITHTNIDAGTYEPDSIIAGEFRILSHNDSMEQKSNCGVKFRHEDFSGKFSYTDRAFSETEKQMIPALESYYIIPEEIVTICQHAKETTGKPSQMRNFLLRGPAGTGKTEGAKAIAAGLGLPYVSYTCSAETDIFDFIGQFAPDTDKESLISAKEESSGKSAFSYESISEKLSLPSIEDMRYDPVSAFEEMTGKKNEDITFTDCIETMMEKFTQSMKYISANENSQSDIQKYTYKETDFIKALKYGWVCEIQEASTISKPGVMTGLNNLLQQKGTIRLQTGEVIERHPDAVIVLTTNTSYEGCRAINESVADRMNMSFDIELPSQEIMTQRVMAITGAEDEDQVINMVKTVDEMAEYCKTHYITGGTVGMRSLIDWINSSMVTKDPYRSALNTVIAKATSDKDDQEALITAVLCHYFSPKKAG